MVSVAQEHDPEAIATWKSLAAAGQDHTPPSSGYQAGIYRSLSEELAANQHSRFTIELKPERDLLEIILTLLDWKEQDTEQIWIRPVAHVDSAEYDSETPSGMEAALLTFMRKVCRPFCRQDHCMLETHSMQSFQLFPLVMHCVDSSELLSQGPKPQSMGLN